MKLVTPEELRAWDEDNGVLAGLRSAVAGLRDAINAGDVQWVALELERLERRAGRSLASLTTGTRS